LEALDNLIEAWSIFSFADFFGALKDNFVKFIKYIFNELDAGIDTQMLYRMAYFAGNVVGFVVEFIIELFVTSGAAAVTKFFTGFASLGEKVIAKLTALLEKLLSISLKEIGKDIVSGLSLVATFFKIKGEKLAEFFAKFFEELKVIFGIGLKPATEALFEKLGLTWRSIRIPILNSGVRLGDQLWGVYHKGVVLIKGTKAEIEAFATKLKGMADDVAKKYLDDLFEAKRFIKSVYGESELSRLAIEYRKGLPVPKHNGNIAIFEYLDESGKVLKKEFTTYSKKECNALGLNKSPHAEILGLEWLEKEKISFDKVRKVYSELEPCSLTESMCKEKIAKNCKNALIEHSFEYPGKETESILTEIRRAAIAEREKVLNKIITN
jgi:Xanthomonas XOO_2897-like deaminase